MMNKVIDISKEFTRYPAGRYESDGPFSGEAFRKRFLEPVISKGEHAVIQLDGARGYGSSFLEEAFGGLVRNGYSVDDVIDTFELKSKDKSLIHEIEQYIRSSEEA